MRLEGRWRRLVGSVAGLMPGRDRRRIGFMHVPKTSGTAMVDALQRTSLPGRSHYAFDRVLFGSYDRFEEFAPGIRRLIHAEPAATLPARADLICGHVSRSGLLASGRDHLMTVLREPQLRLLSHWVFWRSHSEADLARVGSWASRVRMARRPLGEFLADPAIACQTDNLVVRMLLWPHRLIPADGFIDPTHDRELLAEAERALDGFAFADLLENPSLQANLSRWLGRRLDYGSRNVTQPPPPELRTDLAAEMTLRTRALMSARCRLDTALWMRIAQRRIGTEAGSLRLRTLEAGLRRFATLLDGGARPAHAIAA